MLTSKIFHTNPVICFVSYHVVITVLVSCKEFMNFIRMTSAINTVCQQNNAINNDVCLTISNISIAHKPETLLVAPIIHSSKFQSKPAHSPCAWSHITKLTYQQRNEMKREIILILHHTRAFCNQIVWQLFGNSTKCVRFQVSLKLRFLKTSRI
jgi:outer membrane phospholipase A